MRDPREDLVLELLKANWNTDNTFKLTPKISYGWFDKDQNTPQVTVGQPNEGPINGGQTGYSSINTNTGSPNQTISGTVDVHLWAKYDELDKATTNNPRQYLSAVVDELNQIIRENADNPKNPETDNRPVNTLAPGDDNPVPEPDERGLYHHLATVQYIYDSER